MHYMKKEIQMLHNYHNRAHLEKKNCSARLWPYHNLKISFLQKKGGHAFNGFGWYI